MVGTTSLNRVQLPAPVHYVPNGDVRGVDLWACWSRSLLNGRDRLELDQQL
jgi:hypothetical protein